MIDAAKELERGRESYARQAWADAWRLLSEADRAGPLAAEDLELLATTEYMLGRDDDHIAVMERAHQAHLDAGEELRAARCAFWVGMQLSVRGDLGHASGWLARAQRLIDAHGTDCVERGYLLLPAAFASEASGDLDTGAALAGQAAATGARFGDQDLFALAGHMQGHLLVSGGRVEEGLGLLDEAMLAVSTGEVSPIPAGLVYCGVILGCQNAFELRRAQEWTAALSEWCERQPDMVAFTGRCLVHRAEIMQLHGAWPDALAEARRAGRRCNASRNTMAAGEAHYVQGDVHRLRGELEAAEEAYREASRCGREPQPGLALLRLVQGDAPAGAAAIRRTLGETSEPPDRVRLLAACVEIMLSVGEADEARRACSELDEISAAYGSGMLTALVERARGAVELAEGDAKAALPALRRAGRLWQELGAPYEEARARMLVGLACRAVGDHDAAGLELEAAREVFDALGAAPDLARVGLLSTGAPDTAEHGLTQRELEVLRLVAAGHTNKAIAARLVLSERTVDRHVSNIFAKLRVPSRAAATAYAYEHGLVLNG
jgi:DNA-binding CsgD family transcriptional regulator